MLLSHFFFFSGCQPVFPPEHLSPKIQVNENENVRKMLKGVPSPSWVDGGQGPAGLCLGGVGSRM